MFARALIMTSNSDGAVVVPQSAVQNVSGTSVVFVQFGEDLFEARPVQLGNVFYYVREAHNPETVAKYAHDIKVDKWDRWLFNHGLLGPAVGITALCALIGVGWGLLAASLHAVIYVFFLSSSINGLCHSRGYRSFDNTATNIRWLAVLTGGEGLHNNHHGFPRSPKFSVHSGEIDPSWPMIRLLARMKLAHPYRTIEETGYRRMAQGESNV
jgi:fatty-acid desaturase